MGHACTAILSSSSSDTFRIPARRAAFSFASISYGIPDRFCQNRVTWFFRYTTASQRSRGGTSGDAASCSRCAENPGCVSISRSARVAESRVPCGGAEQLTNTRPAKARESNAAHHRAR
jgi:hypothetical protein